MRFRSALVTVWLVAACFIACAHATVDTTSPSVIRGHVEYPASAVSAGEEGTVRIVAEVGINGRAGDARIYRSSGYRDLDAAALRSIAGWSFSPGTVGGKPTAQQVVVHVRFHLTHRAKRIIGFREALATLTGILLRALGGAIWWVGFLWSLVLAKRASNLWLWGMVPLWIFTYPVFVAKHWSVARLNLVVVVFAFALMFLGMYLAPSTLWPRA